MNAALRSPGLVAWVTLAGLTLASFALVESAAPARLAVSAALLIAAVKARLVLAHFMELGWQPRPWRIAFEAVIAAMTAIILGGYWLTAR